MKSSVAYVNIFISALFRTLQRVICFRRLAYDAGLTYEVTWCKIYVTKAGEYIDLLMSLIRTTGESESITPYIHNGLEGEVSGQL